VWIGLMALTMAFAAPTDELLANELDKAMEVLQERPDKPHYVAVALEDLHAWTISAKDGTLASNTERTTRVMDVDMRVGTPKVDSTRPLRGFSAMEGSSRRRVLVPFEEGADDALRHALWQQLDSQYRGGSQRIVMIRAEREVKVEEETVADDFEPRQGQQHSDTPAQVKVDVETWKVALVALANTLDDSDTVFDSSARLSVIRSERTFVDTEGSRIVHGRTHARLSLQVETVADDGDLVSVFRAIDVHDPSSIPPIGELHNWATDAVDHLVALKAAPRGEPYSGPVILQGKATAVFFHEVFGHRVEGHRQKLEYEGKTFAAKVGESILPDFIEVYDDPTLAVWGDVDLNGHYTYDDEGVPAQRAQLVKDGKFTGFLMGRSPLPDVAHSNGHGRRQSGSAPSSRMGNTIVEAHKTVSQAALRKQLLAQIKKQGLDYGYIISDIDGGFTMTGRITPNAFNVRANTTWRVFADGRPDQLIRGIDLVGTPLVAFKSILAASDKVDVFNGMCGAESGWVPVSAVAPGILVERLEFQLKEKGQERPPLLPKPTESDGTADAGVQR
jgi:TldD protein